MRTLHAVGAAAWLALAACNARASDGPADSVRGGFVGSAPADWRRGATCYEVFVRSYFDGDGDGIGDLRGLTQKLDYINDGNPATDRDLGAQCIWLMPVAESPTYHGYDATNYFRVEPDYGTNGDFKAFVTEAHRRGIAVIVDMVLNHLSSEHPYFREALGNPNAAHRGWFRWSTRKPDDLGPWGQEVWHPSPRGSEYYYGTFWRTMPDLDYGSPAVRDEAKRIATFWLTEMGADGFRLDAVPYLVEEGAAKIGTAGTHTFLREYAAHIRTVSPNAFTVGEVWDGIDRMVPYYPDQLESYFAFDLADTLVATIRAGSAAALMRRVLRFQREVPNQRWSTFVRNHDQTRTLTVLAAGAEDTAEGLARAKMAATLLLTLPGLPFVYYGEEIGMIGDKPDELLRTPMPWDASPNAGFTRGTPWQPLEARWPTTNVAAQHDDSASLLSAYRRLIHLRAGTPALGGGDFVPFVAGHAAVAAYLRRNGESIVLVVANVGRRTRSGVTLTADDSVLTPGEYEGRSLLGGAPAASLTVATDGRVRGYMPLGAILPLESHIFALRRIR